MFNLICPRCKAAPQLARLAVVSAKIEIQGVKLEEDGFDLYSAKHMDSEDEVVHCAQCQESFPITECHKEGS